MSFPTKYRICSVYVGRDVCCFILYSDFQSRSSKFTTKKQQATHKKRAHCRLGHISYVHNYIFCSSVLNLICIIVLNVCLRAVATLAYIGPRERAIRMPSVAHDTCQYCLTMRSVDYQVPSRASRSSSSCSGPSDFFSSRFISRASSSSSCRGCPFGSASTRSRPAYRSACSPY